MASLGEHFKLNPDTLIPNESVIFKGVNYRISILSERLIRFEYSLNGFFYDGATEIVHNRNFESPKIKVPSEPNSQSGTTMTKNAETSFVPGAVLMICKDGLSVFAVEWHAPDTTPSASPIFTIIHA